MLTGQDLYNQLSSMDIGRTSDDQFRSMGFPSGRQGAIDALDRLRSQFDPSTIAQKAQAMQVAANQPAIQTLETQYNPDTGKGGLVDKYNALVDSITNAEKPALDVATSQANAANAARGLTPNSELAQKNVSGITAPISTQFGQLQSQTGLSEQQDLGQLASTIAGLKAGNVGNALNFAGGLGQAQTNAAATIAAANAKPYTTVGSTPIGFNTQTGEVNTSGISKLRSLLNNN